MNTLLTVMEAAERLKVGKSTVYNILQSGELPAARIRSAWRIREDDLEKYIERSVLTCQDARVKPGASQSQSG